VLICGASTGIGEQLAYQFAQAGARVVVAARREQPLRLLVDECRKRGATQASLVVADFSEEASSKTAVKRASETMGGLDMIVLNHILPHQIDWYASQNVSFVRQLMEVNFFSYVAIATESIPLLKQSERGGRLVVVSSAAGKVGLPWVAAYSASKHALHGFFDSLRLEFKTHSSNVSVTSCVLGSIDTAANRDNSGGRFDHLPRTSAELTAQAILRGSMLREREVYFPWSETRLLTFVKPFFPSFLDSVLLWTMGLKA